MNTKVNYYSVKLTRLCIIFSIQKVQSINLDPRGYAKYLISASLVGFATVLTQNILTKQNQWISFVSLKD